MPCYHPLDAWIHPTKKTDNGKKLLLFKYDPMVCNGPSPDLQTECGRCVGCRLSKSREWSVRCMHEASLYWDNCWLTLTLNDEYLSTRENPYSVQRGQKSEITRFLKRLRKNMVLAFVTSTALNMVKLVSSVINTNLNVPVDTTTLGVAVLITMSALS